MNKNRNSKNRRGFNRRGAPGNRKFSRGNNFRGRNNRRNNRNKSTISHDKYVSSAVDTEEESLYVEDALFKNFKLNRIVKDNISKRGYIHPTKIQNEVIPQILNDRDIIGKARTGSGKTAAFLLPVITKIMDDRNQKCLVVVPTRELANQIRNEFEMFAKGTNLRASLVIGGANMGRQIKQLNKNPNVVIATPGRLIDLSNKNAVDLSLFNIIVLDEVDQMLDMGFVRDIQKIISKLSDKKQSLFFSATMNKEAEKLANELLNNPVNIEIEQKKPGSMVEQNVIKYNNDEDKLILLNDLLNNYEYDKVLIFSRTRHGADSLVRKLNKKGHDSGVIHGNKSMGHRNKIIARFRKDLNILVATDVAARGIDIPNISHIINYDEPATYDDYLHRIGRTGRIGKKGHALTFIK